MRPANRDRRPGNQPADDHEDHDDEPKPGIPGPLKPLDDGLAARLAGEVPSPQSIALARAYLGPPAGDLMARWNRVGGGSQNINPEAQAVMGNWRWHVELARVWRRQGLFGREFGSNSVDYLLTVLRSLVWAMSAANRVTVGAAAEDIRIAIRAAIFYCALCSVPVARRHSVWLSTDDRFPGDEVDHPNPQAPTAAAAGMRWTVRRGGHDGDAASILVRAALHDPAWWGLTGEEHELLRRIAIAPVNIAKERGDGDISKAEAQQKDARVEVARHVDQGGYLFGILDTPEVRWHVRVRRTTEGVEVLNDSEWPNGNTKQCCSVTMMRMNGEWISARAWPNGWQVEDDGASIITRSLGNHGQPVKPGVVSVARLGGEPIYTLELEGREVRFDG